MVPAARRTSRAVTGEGHTTMTVQTPPEPGHYPSAPPWAVPPEPSHHAVAPPWAVPTGPEPSFSAPLYGGTVAPYGSSENKHGQLLVRFPGEVHDLNRPEAPSWRPVAVWTFLLSALGIISVLRRAALAKRYGRPRRPYWIAFVVMLLAGGAFWPAVVLKAAIPLYHYRQESGLTEQLQTALVSDSRITKRFGTVSAVECTTESERDTEGVRTYLCTFQLSTGKTNGMYVNADTDGNWQEKE
jgi:hypothetical protein